MKLEKALLDLVKPEIAGNPMTSQRWVRLSLNRLSKQLSAQGHTVTSVTVRRLLRKWKFSLRSNRKRFTGPAHPDRDRQFRYIRRMIRRFRRAGWPVISVDAKKKELLGNFKNPGRKWCQKAEEVNCHDFLTEGVGKVTPYGLYLPDQDRGYVYVGLSADTPAFAVDAIVAWWQSVGRRRFPKAGKLLILADAGGSNGCRPRLWKFKLQVQLADAHGLEITVCHYPRGASKWNPVEHRLFSFISTNWAGEPLRSLDILLGYIRGTETTTGLKVKARAVRRKYKKGVKVTDQEMKQLRLHHHRTCPNWNYTIRPRTKKS